MRFNTTDDKNKKEERTTMGQRFLGACVLFLFAIIALTFAVDLLARIWGWLVLIGIIAAAGYVVFRIIRARNDRW